MKVVIAPDSFKESLTAQQVCEAIHAGLRKVWVDAEFVLVPVADGGEGTVQSLVDATQGRLETLTVTGPVGKPVDAFYGILGDNVTAVIEMAAASGLHHVPEALRQPRYTSSYGTGELIHHALELGMTRLIIGLGGSATNDGGVGLLMALGAQFLDENDQLIAPTGEGLSQLCRIDLSNLDRRLQQCDIQVACDVNNPLCGDLGASAIFGPQKGATVEDVDFLDNALEKFGRLTEQATGNHVLSQKGAGAAGGMGAALLGYTNATLKPGIDIVLETVGIAEVLQTADLVITGEGRLDSQTVHGKTPMGVAQLAKQYHLPVLALSGCTGAGYQAVYDCGIDAVFACVPRAMTLPQALDETSENLENLAENVARIWSLMR